VGQAVEITYAGLSAIEQLRLRSATKGASCGLVQARHLDALAYLNIAIALAQGGGTAARFQFETLS
jgi:hypothetical protein